MCVFVCAHVYQCVCGLGVGQVQVSQHVCEGQRTPFRSYLFLTIIGSRDRYQAVRFTHPNFFPLRAIPLARHSFKNTRFYYIPLLPINK